MLLEGLTGLLGEWPGQKQRETGALAFCAANAIAGYPALSTWKARLGCCRSALQGAGKVTSLQVVQVESRPAIMAWAAWAVRPALSEPCFLSQALKRQMEPGPVTGGPPLSSTLQLP